MKTNLQIISKTTAVLQLIYKKQHYPYIQVCFAGENGWFWKLHSQQKNRGQKKLVIQGKIVTNWLCGQKPGLRGSKKAAKIECKCSLNVDKTRFSDFLKSHLMFWTTGFLMRNTLSTIAGKNWKLCKVLGLSFCVRKLATNRHFLRGTCSRYEVKIDF